MDKLGHHRERVHIHRNPLSNFYDSLTCPEDRFLKEKSALKHWYITVSPNSGTPESQSDTLTTGRHVGLGLFVVKINFVYTKLNSVITKSFLSYKNEFC